MCGELFKITILDNDSPGVQIGAVPPEDTGLLARPYNRSLFQFNLSRFVHDPTYEYPAQALKWSILVAWFSST